MSLRNRIFLLFSLSALAILAACGGGNSTPPVIPTPPPTGGFSNSNLNGTYTFSISGVNLNGSFVMAGSFTACGCSAGTISAGTIDVVDPINGPLVGIALQNNSTYQITPDGRGTAALLFNTGANNEIDLDFVLTSSSHGLVVRYDQNGTGSGTLDLLTDVSQSQLGSGNPFFAYSLSGSDTNSTNPLSLASVGEFSIDTTGSITSGTADFNYGNVPSTQLPLAGSVTLGSGTTPGVASLQTTFYTTPLTFDVFTVDANHLKLIENDGHFILAGDVLLSPSGTFPAANLVFNMAGLDTLNNFMAIGGMMASDGVSNISSGFEDVNVNNSVDNNTNPAQPYQVTGTFTEVPASSGRWELTMSGFIGGTQFVAYPYQSGPNSQGFFLLETDGVGVTGGVALQQQSTVSDLASQGYGLNAAGEDMLGPTEADEIAEFKANAGNLTGTVDVNDFNLSPPTSSALSGTYGAAPLGVFTGAGSGTLQAGFGGMFYYVIDDSSALFISSDPTFAAIGSMQAQTAPTNAATKSAQAARLIPMPHMVAHRKSAIVPHENTSLGSREMTIRRR